MNDKMQLNLMFKCRFTRLISDINPSDYFTEDSSLYSLDYDVNDGLSEY